jgi:molybdate transport system substrate-binding protein
MAQEAHEAPSLKVFSVNGVKEVVSRLADAFHAETGEHVRFTFGTIGALQEKIRAGDMPDVLIAMSSAIAKAEEQDVIAKGEGVEVGRTGLGAVVKQGASVPDISTTEQFRDGLLNAKSLAYTDPQTGAASGVAVAEIIAQLGIADRIKDKTVLVGGGPVGEVVAQGRAEVGIQQMTELLPVKGVTFLSAFPPELQRVTVYRAAPLRHARLPQAAAKFVSFLTGANVKKRFAEAGFGRY